MCVYIYIYRTRSWALQTNLEPGVPPIRKAESQSYLILTSPEEVMLCIGFIVMQLVLGCCPGFTADASE